MKYIPVLLALGCAAVASAQPDFENEASTIMTGVQNTSNLWYGDATTGYGFSVTTSASDPAYYLNNIEVVPGSNWDSNINFQIGDGSGNLGNGFPSNNYTLGTAMAQGTTYYWSNVVANYGAFSSSIAPGIYDFDVVFQGGTSASATNTLFDAQLQVDIVPEVDVTVTPTYDQQTIQPGGTSTVSETVTNNMTNQNFVTTTWFIGYPGLQDAGGDTLSGNFVGNWFDQTIAPGQSESGQHSTWTAAANQPAGNYFGDTGIVGGLYDGDQLYFGPEGGTEVIVAAPEPASMVALGLGVLAIVRRRRKS